jgi:hypothetical protein
MLALDDVPEPLGNCGVGDVIGFVQAYADRVPAALLDAHPKDAMKRIQFGAVAIDDRIEQPGEQGALFDAAAAVPLVERGARCEGDQVHRLASVRHLTVEIAKLGRQHRYAGRQRLGSGAANIELRDVLSGDVCV